MGKSAGIPSTQGIDRSVRAVLDPLIEVVETMTGRRNVGKIKPLQSNATLPDVVAKINELLDRLQS